MRMSVLEVLLDWGKAHGFRILQSRSRAYAAGLSGCHRAQMACKAKRLPIWSSTESLC